MNDEQRAAASLTWQAYNAMETTKLRHFDFLTILENKKKNFNIDPTEDDRTLLAQLLRDHDEQVKAFTSASSDLKQQSPEAHLSLFRYIGELSEAFENRKPPH